MVLEEEDENKVKDEEGKLDDLEELSLKRKPKLLMKIKQELKDFKLKGGLKQVATTDYLLTLKFTHNCTFSFLPIIFKMSEYRTTLEIMLPCLKC